MLLGICSAFENKGFCKIWEANKVYYGGECENGQYRLNYHTFITKCRGNPMKRNGYSLTLSARGITYCNYHSQPHRNHQSIH